MWQRCKEFEQTSATLLRLSILVAQKTYRADYLGSGKAQMPFDTASEWPGRQSMRSDQS